MSHNRYGGFMAGSLAIIGITTPQAITGKIFGSIGEGIKKVILRS